ncbi:SEL1-like repeat protein [Bacteroides stercorirosoris]|nr:SEL1-like repeat protein [Bacteroides stercorirosoris]
MGTTDDTSSQTKINVEIELIAYDFKMNKIKRLIMSILSITLSLIGTNAQELTIEECKLAAEKGIFLAQADLGFLYFTGHSQVLGTIPQDYVKSMHYLQLAALNSAARGKETSKLKVLCMAYLAQLYEWGHEHDKRLKTDHDEAFFWAYAALSNELSSDCGEELYKNIIEIAVKGMCEYAQIDRRFVSEFMYLKETAIVKDFAIQYFLDKIYSHAVRWNEHSANSLNFKSRRNKDGSYKYIGELHDGKPNGIGILFLKNAIYCGDFINGKFHGNGYLEYKESGSIKVGEWRNDKLHDGVYYEGGKRVEPSAIYKDGKDLWPRPTSLNIGKTDKRGNVIPNPENMNLSVRWASGLVGSNKSNPTGDLYRWGSTNPNHKFQSSSQSAPNYLPRSACLAIYGGAGRHSDISGTGYDAPFCLWSNSWRMPTLKEMKELISECKIDIEKDGTLKIMRTDDISDGFLCVKVPCGTNGYGIWTGSIDPWDSEKAYVLIIDVRSGKLNIETKDRECDFAILPVTEVPFYNSELYQLP